MEAHGIHSNLRLSVPITLLICFSLSALTIHAQTFDGQPSLSESPASLRATITPLVNSSVVLIQFENRGSGPVTIRFRNQKGVVLFDEMQAKRLYAYRADLASLPAGPYTIELQTVDCRHTEVIRIESPVAGRVVAVSEQEMRVEKQVVNNQ